MARHDGVEEINEKDFRKFISNPLVFIDFWASWCMPCIMMTPIVEEMASKFKQIKFAKVNIDENSRLAEKLKIMSIPTMIVFKNGKEAERFRGSMAATILEEKLSKHLK